MIKQLTITTSKNHEVIDITAQIDQQISVSGLTEGVCTLVLAHTTAGLTTADLDPGMAEDLTKALWVLVPKIGYHSHHDPAHAPSHVLGALIGPSLSLIIQKGQLVLGTWQRVVLLEFDGPKQRQLWLFIK